jgi:hypothetical protein
LPDNPDFPVSYELSRASAHNLARVSEIAADLIAIAPENPSDETIRSVFAEIKRCVEDALEISGWLFPEPRTAKTLENAIVAAAPYRELGKEWEEKMIEDLQKGDEGRPPTKRRAHIEAFEFMLQSKSNSLNKAVRRFCMCGGVHAKKCRLQFRTGIQSLKKILRKFAPHLVVTYDALHPDRSKKAS